uniref:Uncharacterized protein n=1 Tax=Magallana gigas TaxID=29159 RepID=A0A8W8P4B3_MAGGI
MEDIVTVCRGSLTVIDYYSWAEYEALCFPHRSTTFATNLQHLSLEYCGSITDSDIEDIVTVCRGSLTVIDYYSWAVKPRLLKLNMFLRRCKLLEKERRVKI